MVFHHQRIPATSFNNSTKRILTASDGIARALLDAFPRRSFPDFLYIPCYYMFYRNKMKAELFPDEHKNSFSEVLFFCLTVIYRINAELECFYF
jgi:hypothetical protein